jgi:hypothetical protein
MFVEAIEKMLQATFRSSTTAATDSISVKLIFSMNSHGSTPSRLIRLSNRMLFFHGVPALFNLSNTPLMNPQGNSLRIKVSLRGLFASDCFSLSIVPHVNVAAFRLWVGISRPALLPCLLQQLLRPRRGIASAGEQGQLENRSFDVGVLEAAIVQAPPAYPLPSLWKIVKWEQATKLGQA